MILSISLLFIWAVLMIRSMMAEYQYYQSVKKLEPEIWQKLGSPALLKVPFVFISPNGKKQLQQSQNQTVAMLADRHRKTGIQFLAYVMLTLVVLIIYFKTAL